MVVTMPRGEVVGGPPKSTPPGCLSSQTTPRSELKCRRFCSAAETLSPYPDGVCLRAHREHIPNPELMDTAIRNERKIPLDVKSFTQIAHPLDVYFTGTGGSCVFRRSDLNSEDFVSPDDCHYDAGYWTLAFVTESGEKVGVLKMVAPFEGEVMTFNNVIDTIQERAALLNFHVIYATYFDRDFGTYALLTPQTLQFHTDRFQVVVEMERPHDSEAADAPVADAKPLSVSPLRGGGSPAVDAVKRGNNVCGTSLKPPQILTSLLFRAPRVVDGVVAGGEVSGEARRPLQLEEVLYRSLKAAEEEERSKIAMDESTSRLILHATESTAMYRMLRYKRVSESPCKPDASSSRCACDIFQRSPTVDDCKLNNSWSAHGEGGGTDNTTSSMQLSLIEKLDLFSLHFDPPTKADKEEPALNVIKLRITSRDKDWNRILQAKPKQLEEAIASDLCLSLGVRRMAVTVCFTEPSSLTVTIVRPCCDTRTNKELQVAMSKFGFPNLMKIYDTDTLL
uniref:WGS project CAEQ00000000 data, annotated contig 555 n=1 Tax=Trypanosoma congolense (strain IL3000) TaxID=1068625 RepID=F9WGV2_TRYCI|nr:unnamed protein product [Trypanosoma congolense IL3000]